MNTQRYPGEEFDDMARDLLSPTDYQNPQPQPRYHLVVVGAGPAGLISAIGAAGLGAKVALIERHRMGGDCLNVGCMPSKALLAFSKQRGADFQHAFAWLREVRAGIAPHDSVERYIEAGVDVFLGDALFNAAGQICVGDTPLNARRIALCTGASAAIPPIPGLVESRPLTNETIFDLPAPPSSLAILGAGAIGCELALALSRLGVSVSLFEMAERVLPLETPLASQAVAMALESSGVDLYLGQGVSAVKGSGTVVVGGQEIECERILVALGRKPNTDGLNLGAAGVSVDQEGFVLTNAKLQSNNKRIFAAGDWCSAAAVYSSCRCPSSGPDSKRSLCANGECRCIGRPPLYLYGSGGRQRRRESRRSLEKSAIAFDRFEFDLSELDRSRADPDSQLRPVQHAEVYTQKGSDKILGATIIGHDAGELIAPICLMMSNGLGLSAAQKTIFSYPTRSDYLKRLGDAYNRNRMTPTVARLFRWRLRSVL